MSNAFAELEINPFEDDVVTEPRRVSFSVKGLNDKPLQQLIARFRELTPGEPPRQPIVARKAQLVVSPDRGYGKSHLLGRLFKHLGDKATLIYLRPFQDPQRIWSSILLTTIRELERPNQDGGKVSSQLETFASGVLAHVAADFKTVGKISARVESAIRDLRDHPLKVRFLVDWFKSGLDDQDILQRLAGHLRQRGIDLFGRETAWLRVLAAYALSDANSLERDAALKWLRGDPLEQEEMTLLKLVSADNEGKADSSAYEINQLCFQRLRGLCFLSSYYRPFVFCFDQTEFYGSDRALVTALAKGIDALHATVPNQLTIVTTNATNWTAEILPFMDPAYRDRFSAEISLEGINTVQAEELIKARLTEFKINEAAITVLVAENWLEKQFAGLAQKGVRDVLVDAAARFRALAGASVEPRPTMSLVDLFAIEVNKIRTNKALHQYNQDCLMWFVQALAEDYHGVMIEQTRERYFTLRWSWQDRSIYFAFEAGDHHARWKAISKEAIELLDSTNRSRAIVFRTPDLHPIPRWTRGGPKVQIADAQKRGLRIVSLSLDEVCELHAARELYSNARQGNIHYNAQDVLNWLKARFESWINRYSQLSVELSPVEGGHATPISEDPKRPVTSPQNELTKAQVEAVLECVSQRKLVDIREVLQMLGGETLREALLRMAERNPNLKAHSGPQTIYLQWREVA